MSSERGRPRTPLGVLSELALTGGDESEMARAAVSAVGCCLGVEIATYHELEPESGRLVLRAAIGCPEQLLATCCNIGSRGPRWAVGHATPPADAAPAATAADAATAAAAATAADAVTATDAATAADAVTATDAATGDLARPCALARFLERAGARAGLAAVVHGGEGEVLGVLGAHACAPDELGSGEVEELRTVANVLAAGILRRRSESRFHAVVQNCSDLIAVVDARAELLYANPNLRRLLGLGDGDVRGVSTADFLHPDDVVRTTKAFRRDASHPGSGAPALSRFRTAAGGTRYLEVVATNCLDDPAVRGIVLNGRDVTAQVNVTRVLRTLSASNHALVSATDEASLLGGACRAIVGQEGFALAWVGYRDYDEAKTVRVVASAGRAARYLRGIDVGWGEQANGGGLVGAAIRSGRAQVLDDLRTAPKFAPWRSRAESMGLRSACALPLRLGEELIGTLAIYAEEPAAFRRGELALLGQLAEDLSYGIGRLRDAAALRASEERFRALAANAPIGIIECSAAGEVEFANARAHEIVGFEIAGEMGERWLESVHPDDLGKAVALVERVRVGQKGVQRIRLRHRDGEVRHVSLAVAQRGPGHGAGVVATLEDVTDEALAHQALGYQASHDALTGLGNRMLLLDLLRRDLAQLGSGGPGLAVLFFDLDHFKEVNDRLGHLAGDELLRQVGERLRRGARSDDIVARFGGDEFVFVAHGVSSAKDALEAARRLQRLLGKPIVADGQELRLTASTGIVMPVPGAEVTAVIRDADAAMYAAKADGRARAVLFDDELRRRCAAGGSLGEELPASASGSAVPPTRS